LIHVDDLLFAGSRDFWEGKFLLAVTSKFNVNFSEGKGDGSSIHFLKRQLVKVKDGLLTVPGTTAGKIIAYLRSSLVLPAAKRFHATVRFRMMTNLSC